MGTPLQNHSCFIDTDHWQGRIGVDIATKNYKDFRVQIYDTVGLQRYRSLMPGYIKNKKYFIVVYDVTDLQQEDNVARCFKDIEQNVENKQQIKILLLGNQIGLLKKGDVNIIPEIQKIYGRRPHVTCRASSWKEQNGNIIQMIDQFAEDCYQYEKIKQLSKQKAEICSKIQSEINKMSQNIQLQQLCKDPNYTKRMEGVLERLRKKKNLQEIAFISELIKDFKYFRQLRDQKQTQIKTLKLQNQKLHLQLKQKNEKILKLEQEVIQLRSIQNIQNKLSQKNIEYQYWLFQAKQFITSNQIKHQTITPKIHQFLRFVNKIDEEYYLPANINENQSFIFDSSESLIADNLHKLKEKLQAEKQLQKRQLKGPQRKLQIMEEIIEDLIQSVERQEQVVPVAT